MVFAKDGAILLIVTFALLIFDEPQRVGTAVSEKLGQCRLQPPKFPVERKARQRLARDDDGVRPLRFGDDLVARHGRRSSPL